MYVRVTQLTSFVVHGIRNIRNVVSSIRLSSNEDLAVVQAEGIDKVLPETEELSSNLNLICRGRRTLLWAEACTGGLLDPDNIGKVYPSLSIAEALAMFRMVRESNKGLLKSSPT